MDGGIYRIVYYPEIGVMFLSYVASCKSNRGHSNTVHPSAHFTLPHYTSHYTSCYTSLHIATPIVACTENRLRSWNNCPHYIPYHPLVGSRSRVPQSQPRHLPCHLQRVCLLPAPHASGPDIVFYIRINDNIYRCCFVQLKLRQVLEGSDIEKKLATVSSNIIQAKMDK